MMKDNLLTLTTYFESLPSVTTTKHIKKLCNSLKLVDEEFRPISHVLLQEWLIAACASALGYNNTNHICLVLIGEEGRYKGTWLNSLCPQELKKFLYSGHIEPSLTQGETKYLLSEKFILNIDDQPACSSKRRLSALTSIITSPDLVKISPKTERRRIASFCAAVENDNFLTDAGNRHYACIEVDKCEVLPDEIINMVWAEVYTIVKRDYKKEPA